MSIAVPASGPTISQRYAGAVAARRRAGHQALDETIDLDGSVPDGTFWDHLDGLGVLGLMSRRREVDRLVRDEGIASAPGMTTRWQVDPIPLVIDEPEWTPLAEGLQQRARLLDAILTDLHGERRLIRDRLLPAELFLGHDDYLLPAHGITLPGPRQLPIAGADLVHTRDGWVVLTDRTQAPAGIGYALANRRLVTRVMEPLFRASRASRLRGFFDVMQHALHRAAPAGVTNPRIVLLSPGPTSETAYDQALVATLLGHPLVLSDDLIVQGGAVWLRTSGRRHRVDVIQRRVDGDWMDPLDLRSDSRLGVTGLLAAARRGVVSVVNPIGSGVLENVGMGPYLAMVCRAVLGEELLLPNPRTWWCGDPADRSHVLANLHDLVIRPISRTRRPTIIPGWELGAEARADLAARIIDRPYAWAAQEHIESSTAPVITGDGLSPRPMVLRTFRIAVDDDYIVMPGGFAKVAQNEQQSVVLNERGVIAKDVWVLESSHTPAWSSLQLVPAEEGTSAMPALTPRAAGDLYWLGRYAERVEATARLVAVADNLADDHLARPGSPGHQAMDVILGALGRLTGIERGVQPEQDPSAPVLEQLRTALTDPERVGSVAYAAERTADNAIAVRELLSPETVGILSTLSETLREAREDEGLIDAQRVSASVLQSSLALAGIAAESLVRDEIWTFMDAGRRLERAQALIGLLRHTVTERRSPVTEAVIVEMALRAADTLITYRRRMAAGVGSVVPAVAAVELILADPANPRSVRYQLDRLVELFEGEDDVAARVAAEATRAILSSADLEAAFAAEREGIRELLSDLEVRLRALSRAIERTYFAPQPSSRAFTVQELEQ